MVKNICSSRGPGLDFPYLQGISQTFVTPLPGDALFWPLRAPDMHLAHRHTASKTPIYIKIIMIMINVRNSAIVIYYNVFLLWERPFLRMLENVMIHLQYILLLQWNGLLCSNRELIH